MLGIELGTPLTDGVSLGMDVGQMDSDGTADGDPDGSDDGALEGLLLGRACGRENEFAGGWCEMSTRCDQDGNPRHDCLRQLTQTSTVTFANLHLSVL